MCKQIAFIPCVLGRHHHLPFFHGEAGTRVPANPGSQISTIWTQCESLLRDFIESLNCCHPTIKFTATWSAHKVTSLDTTVYLENGRIRTNLHIKPTDQHLYFRMNSCPPPFTVQLLSPIAKSSDSDAFAWRNRFLKIGPTHLNSIFFRAAMSSTWINKQIQRALNTCREACLQQNRTGIHVSVLIFLCWSLIAIQFYLSFTRPPSDIFYPSHFWMMTECFSVLPSIVWKTWRVSWFERL